MKQQNQHWIELVVIVVVIGSNLVVGVGGGIGITTATVTDGSSGAGMDANSHALTQTEAASNATNASNGSNATTTTNTTNTSNTSTTTENETSPTQTNRPTNASVALNKTETNRSRVELDSVALPENGFIVIHNASYSPDSPGSESIIGRTQYVRGGNYSNVYVPLFNITDRDFNHSQITGTQRIHVLLYNDSNGDRTFDAEDDHPYRNTSDDPITASAVIGGEQTKSNPTNASVTIDENQTTSSQVILDSVALPENGFIVVHNASYSPESPRSKSIIGRAQYIKGDNYSNVEIELYNNSTRKSGRSQTTGAQRIFVLIYNDSNGNQAFDAESDQPYRNSSGNPISDSITIEGIDTGRLGLETNSTTSRSSSASPTTDTSSTTPAASSSHPPEQPSHRTPSGQQNSDASNGGPGFWRIVGSAILIIFGGILVYRGLRSRSR